MANDNTKISWCDSTWNCVTGCTHVSAGCKHCYAEALSLRFGHTSKPWIKPHEAENVALHPERLGVPLRWRQPRRIFVNSMSDLFHPLVPFEFVDRVFGVMARCPRHVFQVLTKRPERMREYAASGIRYLTNPTGDTVGQAFLPDAWPLPNCWLGTSVEDQRAADERIPHLIATPAAVRFLSVEPMLGPVNLRPWLWDGDESVWPGRNPSWAIDWVICGGESGPSHRRMDVRWVADLADQCRLSGIAFWCKQDSGRLPERQGRIPDELWRRKEFPAVATDPAPVPVRQEAMTL